MDFFSEIKGILGVGRAGSSEAYEPVVERDEEVINAVGDTMNVLRLQFGSSWTAEELIAETATAEQVIIEPAVGHESPETMPSNVIDARDRFEARRQAGAAQPELAYGGQVINAQELFEQRARQALEDFYDQGKAL